MSDHLLEVEGLYAGYLGEDVVHDVLALGR